MLITRQFRHELFKLFARKRTYIGFGGFLLLEASILVLLRHPRAEDAAQKLLERNGLAFDEYYQGLTLAIVVIGFAFLLLGALYVALVGGDIVAKEVEDGTMRMILARPVGRLRLLLIKLAACFTYTVALVAFLGGTALLMGVIYKGRLGKLFIFVPDEELFAFFDTAEGLWRYAGSMALLAYGTLMVSACAFMFSCFKVKPAAATILTLSLFFLDFVLQNIPYFAAFRHWFITYHFGCWVRIFHDPIPLASLLESLAYITGLIATFCIVGIAHFCVRDLKT